jgi:hypothetical protein
MTGVFFTNVISFDSSTSPLISHTFFFDWEDANMIFHTLFFDWENANAVMLISLWFCCIGMLHTVFGQSTIGY